MELLVFLFFKQKTAYEMRISDWISDVCSSDLRELGTRNIKVALRRLRRFAREGAPDELDLDATIRGTARQGWLAIVMRPERHKAVKLLLFLDVGEAMDPHLRLGKPHISADISQTTALDILSFHTCPHPTEHHTN